MTAYHPLRKLGSEFATPGIDPQRTLPAANLNVAEKTKKRTFRRIGVLSWRPMSRRFPK